MTQVPEPEGDSYESILQRLIARGSEPYWMQDTRLAQRRIASQIESLRAQRRDSELQRRSLEGDQAASDN